MTRRGTIRALVFTIALAVAGCGNDEPAPGAAETGEPPTTEAATTTAAEAADTTSTAAEVTTTTEAAAPAFPPQRVGLEQGGDAIAVVLFASTDFEDPGLARATAAAEAAGYSGAEPTDCDAGAGEVFGIDPALGSVLSVSVYFETLEEAEQARAAFEAAGYEGAVVGTVQTFCLD